MDPRFIVTREEFQDVQMDLKRMQNIQHQHSERLRLLEKRQADDAALRSVWNSPFPSALGGTPQHGPVHIPTNELSDEDLDERGETLLGSLRFEAEDEPIRRGAASRANSVRFDESALHGANFGGGGHGIRHSGEFGPIRPGSSLGGHQMERSLSHKSDGRHSSAGHSVHSGVSGRASSLGLDTNFAIGGEEDDSSLEIPEPPPLCYILGSAPSIIRCWLTTTFTSGGLLYAAVCTGSQKSTVEYSLLKELDLVNNIHREVDGVHRIRLPVFLAEARVMHASSRPASPAPQLPSITASFEVTNMDQADPSEPSKKSIRVVIGSHTLRMHSADLLLSQNQMTLYGSDRDKLSIPFVRPEDDAVFKHLTTINAVPGRTKLNAAAPEFVAGDKVAKPASTHDTTEQNGFETKASVNGASDGVSSPIDQTANVPGAPAATPGAASENSGESNKAPAEPGPEAEPELEPVAKEAPSADPNRREPSAAIRTPWRQTAAAGLGADNNAPLSGYQRPRNMKVLRPTKAASASSAAATTASSSARTGAAYEPAPGSGTRSAGEPRRKAQVLEGGTPSNAAANSSWSNAKRSLSTTAIGALGSGLSLSAGSHNDSASKTSAATAAPRSAANPLGSATAFSWIKPKTPAAAAD